jgi:hypothetical protein
METLRSSLVRLAKTNPTVRGPILDILRTSAPKRTSLKVTVSQEVNAFAEVVRDYDGVQRLVLTVHDGSSAFGTQYQVPVGGIEEGNDLRMALYKNSGVDLETLIRKFKLKKIG